MAANLGTSPPAPVDPAPARHRPYRALLSAAVAVAALWPASVAAAAEPAPGVRWKAAGEQPGEEAAFSGRVTLRADVVTDRPVDGWSVAVVTTAGQPAFGVICHEAFNRPRREFDVKCRWDTARYSDERHSANGHYLIRLTTQEGTTAHPAGPDRAAAVNNPPSPPAAVAVSHHEQSGKATLTWAANPEPDIAHYDVERKAPDGEWTRVGETSDTRFEVATAKPADHRYRVAAERRNADGLADGPGPWTRASESQPRGRDGATPKQPERADRPERAERPAARAPQPGTDRRRGPDPDSGKAATAQGSTAPGGTAKTTIPPAEQPPPSERAALAFSPNSGQAFASVHDAPSARSGLSFLTAAPGAGKQAVLPKPATRPSATPVRDPGFDEALPYELPTEPEPPAAATEEPAVPATPAAAAPPGRGSNIALRLAGIGLIVAGVGLFSRALRPAHRDRRPGPAVPTETGPVPGPVAVPGEHEPTWLARLEDCVTRLEASLEPRPAPAPPGEAPEAA